MTICASFLTTVKENYIFKYATDETANSNTFIAYSDKSSWNYNCNGIVIFCCRQRRDKIGVYAMTSGKD